MNIPFSNSNYYDSAIEVCRETGRILEVDKGDFLVGLQVIGQDERVVMSFPVSYGRLNPSHINDVLDVLQSHILSCGLSYSVCKFTEELGTSTMNEVKLVFTGHLSDLGDFFRSVDEPDSKYLPRSKYKYCSFNVGMGENSVFLCYRNRGPAEKIANGDLVSKIIDKLGDLL